MATKQHFLTLRGESFGLTIAGLKDKEGNDLDLTGHTLTLTFRDKNENVLHEIEYEVDDVPVRLVAPVAEVETWPSTVKYVLSDAQPNGEVRFFAYGSITVREVD